MREVESFFFKGVVPAGGWREHVLGGNLGGRSHSQENTGWAVPTGHTPTHTWKEETLNEELPKTVGPIDKSEGHFYYC